jgi:hypothetical protein
MYKVYYTDLDGSAHSMDHENLNDALLFSSWMRTCNARFVTMVSEDPNSIGKPGVDEIVNGKLPDGTDYEWKKRRV